MNNVTEKHIVFQSSHFSQFFLRVAALPLVVGVGALPLVAGAAALPLVASVAALPLVASSKAA